VESTEYPVRRERDAQLRDREDNRAIDRTARAADFRAVVENAKQKSRGYDYLMPVSGGTPRRGIRPRLVLRRAIFTCSASHRSPASPSERTSKRA
jgi:hypothetical protein